MRTIVVTNPDNDAYKKELAFKNNAPFVSCISKINKTLIVNAEYLDFVMPMYNLLEYSKNYSRTTGSLSIYYTDEPNRGAGGENSNINYSINSLKSFDYKTSITGKLEGINTSKEVEIVVPLKHLSNFQRTIDMSLTDYEINLILTWSTNCVLTSKTTRDENPDVHPSVAAINNPTGAAFKIADTNCTSQLLLYELKMTKHF